MKPQKSYSVEEVAAFCKVKASLIASKISKGNLRTVPGSNPPMITEEMLEEWLKSQEMPQVVIPFNPNV